MDKHKIELKDVLHLYLGCECMIGDLNWKREKHTHGLAPDVDLDYGKPIRTTIDAHVLSVFAHKTTPILRRLSSMTEEEKEKLFDFLWPDGIFGVVWAGKLRFIEWLCGMGDAEPSELNDDIMQTLSLKQISEITNWLRKNQFDADELIENGYALEFSNNIEEEKK